MTPLRILTESISRAELASLAEEGFGDMVKAVVDVRREVIAIGGERPKQGNRSRDVEDEGVRERIRSIVARWVVG